MHDLPDDGGSVPLAEVVESQPARPRDFARRAGHQTQIALMTAFGIGAIAIGLLLFAMHLFLLPDLGQIALHGTTTLPIIMGVFAIYGSRLQKACPALIRLWPQGLEVIDDAGQIQQKVAFRDVARLRKNESAGGWGESIELVGQDGESLVEISNAITNYAELRRTLRQRVEQQGTKPEQTPNEPSHQPQRSWKRVLGFGFAAVMCVLGTVFMAYTGFHAQYAAKAMAEQAQLGTGVLNNKVVAPNGRTKRAYVEVAGEDGSIHEHNFEVTDEFFEQLTTGQEVDVRYVPSDPAVAELVRGQVNEESLEDSPLVNFLAAAVFVVMTLLFAAVAVLGWMGYDLDFEDGKLRWMPLG